MHLNYCSDRKCLRCATRRFKQSDKSLDGKREELKRAVNELKKTKSDRENLKTALEKLKKDRKGK